ncbi:hypothetical protein AWB67_01905 [Caballeronia terrestris]|uniref:Uncharacterized protein n=2 Tax=Caballeronia terrestris TaxID=1226301 RepID=A0A158HMW2_9BURK|nr:hypothetical protein AWB67_01905 [Caballeronia terrestris]
MNFRHRLAFRPLQVMFAAGAATSEQAARAPSLRQAALIFAGVAPMLASAATGTVKHASTQADEPYQTEMMDSVLIEEPYQAPRVKRPARPQAKASVQRTSVARRRTAPRSGFNVTSAKIRGASEPRVAVTDVASRIVREQETVAMPIAAMSAIAKPVNAEPRPQPIFDDWTSAAAIAESAYPAYDGWSRSAASSSDSGAPAGEMAASASFGLAPVPDRAAAAGVTGARLTERVAAPAQLHSTVAGVAIVTASETAAGATLGRSQPILPVARVVPSGSDPVADPWGSAWFSRSGSMQGGAAKAFDATLVAAPREDSSTDWTRVSEVRPDSASTSSREVW